MTFWGIVVAAGTGTRFGGAKTLEHLGDRPLWQWGRDLLAAGGASGVVVVGEVPGGVPGGERRRDSVAAGLAQVPEDVDIVVVHDAARPLASPDLLASLLERLAAGDADAVIPVVPVVDALKQVEDGWVTASLDRGSVGAVQTPQGFRASVLRAAHEEVGGDAPDDAWLVEQVGGRVAVVPGEPGNRKITYPSDLDEARARLQGQRP